MTTITRERLKELSVGQSGFNIRTATHEESMEMAGIVLSSLEAEPVLYMNRFTRKAFTLDEQPGADKEPNIYVPLYTVPPAPVVPDEYRHLSELYHAQEKRLFKLAQRIKGPAFDKYAHSPSQAIDVLESAVFGEDADSCRAAMLQGKGE